MTIKFILHLYILTFSIITFITLLVVKHVYLFIFNANTSTAATYGQLVM